MEVTYLNEFDQFLNKNSLDSGMITNVNSDKMIADGSINACKITDLQVGTITVNSTGYVRSGKTSFTDSSNSGWFLGSEGVFIGSLGDTRHLKYTISTGGLDLKGAVIDSTSTIAGRISSVLAGAIDASGHFADNAINTANKTILLGLTFGSTDYSGSLKTGDITWNASTGAITGGSGVVISKAGIIGASNGVKTFSINGTTGVAVLSGLVVGTNVGLGTAQTASQVTTIIGATVTTGYVNALSITARSVSANDITAGTITGSTLQTGTTGENVNITTNYISLRNGTSEQGSLRGYSTIYGGTGSILNVSDVNCSYITNRGSGNVILNGGNYLYLEGTSIQINSNGGYTQFNGTVYITGSSNISYSSSKLQLSSDTRISGSLYSTSTNIYLNDGSYGYTDFLLEYSRGGVNKYAYVLARAYGNG